MTISHCGRRAEKQGAVTPELSTKLKGWDGMLNRARSGAYLLDLAIVVVCKVEAFAVRTSDDVIWSDKDWVPEGTEMSDLVAAYCCLENFHDRVQTDNVYVLAIWGITMVHEINE